jgi:hypothetical protein
MTCERVRAAIVSADEADAGSAAVRAHLAACEACAMFAVEWSLRQAPPVGVPASFAADVARRARVEAGAASRRSSGPAIGLAAAFALLVAAAIASRTTSDGALGLLPMALLLLACGEAIVFAAWSVGADVQRDS